jgi:hypothetical protein
MDAERLVEAFGAVGTGLDRMPEPHPQAAAAQTGGGGPERRRMQLVEAVNRRYDQVNSLSATVDFAASVGGAHTGKQTDYTSIHGYIRLRKPQMLRVLGYLPVVRLRAFDLASDGKHLHPADSSQEPRHSGKQFRDQAGEENPLENLRPEVFSDRS